MLTSEEIKLIQSITLIDTFTVSEEVYLQMRRKELKRHAQNTHKNMTIWWFLNKLYPFSKPLMEELYWHP